MQLPEAGRPVEDQRRGPPVGSADTTVARSLVFVVAALCEIGGAWQVWQESGSTRAGVWIGAGVVALGLYGVVATFQSDNEFGRNLAAYGGIFAAGLIAWAMVADGYRPDRYDVIGALVCVAGTTVIMYAPRRDLRASAWRLSSVVGTTCSGGPESSRSSGSSRRRSVYRRPLTSPRYGGAGRSKTAYEAGVRAPACRAAARWRRPGPYRPKSAFPACQIAAAPDAYGSVRIFAVRRSLKVVILPRWIQ